MMQKSVLIIVAGLILAVPCAVQAEEERLLNLWPNQRAQHLVNSEIDAIKYKERGQVYVDHLYLTGGETQIAPDTQFVVDKDKEGGAPVPTPVPVNVNQVSDILKDSALPPLDIHSAAPQ